MIKFIIFLILFQSAVFASSEDAAKILRKFAHETDTIHRMDLMSRSFLGLPYGSGGPLGEGHTARFDQDPLYRFDTFDCTTYIETMISLALSGDVATFENWMNEIRYENGQIDYLTRNHFPSLQWIPNNIKNGLLEEINHYVVAPSEIKLAEAIINLPGWLKAIKIGEIKVPEATQEERQFLLEELQAYSSQYSPVLAKLAYIPIPTLLKNPHLIKNIPHGSIVNFVRPNWDIRHLIGTNMNVSHQGLLFRKGTVLFLRHASTSGEVTELPLLDYLKKFENHPTLKGIHLMKLVKELQ